MIYDDIQNAINTGAIIEIVYKKPDGTSSIRRLSDVTYSEEYGNSYIEAFCHLRSERRTFKIDRIGKVTFVNAPDVAEEQSVLVNPTNVKMPYQFNVTKKIFKLYGIDYNC